MKKNKNLLSRRELLKKTVFAGVGLVAAPMINLNRYQLFANSPTEYSAKAIDLVGKSTVVDMLSVLTLDFTKLNKWMSDPESFTAADFQPFKDSGINIIHPAFGLGGTNAYETTLKFFASLNAFITDREEF